MITKKKKTLLTVSKEDLLKNAKPSTLFEDVQRHMHIACAKADYSRNEMIEKGMCTGKEYDSIKTIDLREMNHERDRNWSIFGPQIIGSETY